MTDLTRDQILERINRPRPVQPVAVPEWGGVVYVKVLTSNEQLAIDAPEREMPREILARSLCDSEGKPLFGPEDAAALGDEEFPVLMRLFTHAAKANGLSVDELEAAMENFGHGAVTRSSTELPSPLDGPLSYSGNSSRLPS